MVRTANSTISLVVSVEDMNTNGDVPAIYGTHVTASLAGRFTLETAHSTALVEHLGRATSENFEKLRFRIRANGER